MTRPVARGRFVPRVVHCQRVRPTLLERIHDLPEDVCWFLATGRDDRLMPFAFGFVVALLAAAVIAQLWIHFGRTH